MKKRAYGRILVTVLLFTLLAGMLAACGTQGGPEERQAQKKGKAESTVTDVSSTRTADTRKTSSKKKTPENGVTEATGKAKASSKESGGGTSLIDFCNDPEVDAFFASLETEPPVKLEFWVYGMAPYAMEFTDPELIRATAEALAGVRIGGRSDMDPDSVNDAGGNGYSFTMADGSGLFFSFVLGTFRWKDSGYYNVADFGDLGEISEKLEQIGNPQYVYAFSEDRGFYTKALETYPTEWTEEEALFGGLRICTGKEGEPPFVSIARCGTEETDAETYLETDAEKLLSGITEDGWTVKDSQPVQKYTFGKETLPGILYTVADQSGTERKLLVLAMEKKDSLLRKMRIVRFCAVYQEDREKAETNAAPGVINSGPDTEEARTTEALKQAIRYFSLKHMYYEKGDPKPGNTLLDFCNDDSLRAWFENTKTELPADLTYTTDRWRTITDPESMRLILDVLQTVKIGDISEDPVGGADRQVFDFSYHSGDTMTFMFFADTFYWDGENYTVLDWGELKDLDLYKMAE